MDAFDGLRANLDQADALLRDQARLLSGFLEALQSNGFTRTEAFELVEIQWLALTRPKCGCEPD